MSAASRAKPLLRSMEVQPRADIDSTQLQPAALHTICHRPLTPDPSLPTIVFLPYWGGSASTFEAVQLKLSETHPYQTTIAVSYRGTTSLGRNEPDPVENHDIPALAADVLALLESLRHNGDDGLSFIPSRKVALCAHSMSAKVAWEMLRILTASAKEGTTNIDEKKFSVTALLLLAPAPVGPLELPAEMQEQQLKAYESMESATWTLRNVLTHRNLSDKVLARVAEDCVSMSAGAKRGWIELGMKRDCMNAVREAAADLERNGKLKGFQVAVLVGDRDKVETAEKVKRETVDVLDELRYIVKMRLLAEVGHLLPVEAPDEVVFELGKLL